MADAYLVEATTPSGEIRSEIYHTQAGAEQTVTMYAPSNEGWKTRVYPLVKLPEAGDSAGSPSRPDNLSIGTPLRDRAQPQPALMR